MKVKMQHFLRITSVLLVLAVLLPGQTPSTIALETRQEPPPKLVVRGSGDFPRLPVVAPDADGLTLALYLVEGDTATQLVTLEGTRIGSNRADAYPSPDGRYVACLRTEGDYLRPVLEVVDTQQARRVVIAEGAKDVPERGAVAENLTSVAWMDAGHILYSKVRWPSSQEWVVSWETGTPLPVQGEIWLSDVDGEEQRLLATGPIYRVLGVSPEGETLYVTRLIPGREENREEGFALLDLESGEVGNLWPQEERGKQRYHSFKLIALPDGTRRALFATAERVDTAVGQPPVMWMADLESGRAEAIWTIDQGKTIPKYGTTIYDIPRDFLWSPHSEQAFIYLVRGATLGGVWRVDLEAGKAERLGKAMGKTGLRLLAWTPEGIVIQSQDVILLLDENGDVQGEIRFREDEGRPLAASQVSSTIVDWDVPYIHQIYDTPAWFHGGWACGPTSVVMALAHYKRLPPRSEGYGWYVPNEYTHRSACSGENTFDRMQDDAAEPPHEARGAYGACTNNGVAIAWRMYEYAEKHDVGYYFESAPTEGAVMGELDGGAVVILSTDLTGAGHIIVVRGYTNDSPTKYIVNDPAGDWHDGYYNHNGDGAQYTWAEMSPNWYIALYGPECLPYVYKSYDSSDGSTIIVHNGAQDVGWNADIDVCLMNSDGSLNRIVESVPIPPNGNWNLWLYNEFGWYGSFSGSAVVRCNQTAVSVVVVNTDPQRVSAYTGLCPPGMGDYNWEEIGTDVYLPHVYRKWGYESLLTIFNPGPSNTSVTITYVDKYDGDECSWGPVSIPANGTRQTTTGEGVGEITFFGSAHVHSSAQPVAVLADALHEDGDVDFNNTALNGAETVWLSDLMKDYYNWDSCFTVQNLSDQNNLIHFEYYWFGGQHSPPAYTLEPNRAQTFCQKDIPALPDQDPLSARVWSNDYPIAVGANTANSDAGRHKSYSAFAEPSTTLILPHLARNVEISGRTWVSGIRVQNTSSSYSTTPTITYYRANGTQKHSTSLGSIPPGASATIYLPSVEGLSDELCSAVVTASQPLVASVNGVCTPGCSGDTDYTYNGVNR